MEKNHHKYQAGDVIDGKYRILHMLGAGGFATVYRAFSEPDQCEIALKIMHDEADESYIERFKREAMFASKIRHPNIVKIYGCGSISSSGQPYIAMQLLVGHDLEEELKKNGPLSPHRMFVLIRPVLEALGIGHAQGIVHKDLKPANLYLIHPGQPDEYVTVLDFGVARSAEYQKLTTTGQIVGTALYMAPEYIRHQTVTPAIDVYQMALIISELLTGRTAIQAEGMAMLMKHCMGEIELADFLKTGPAKEVFSLATCTNHNLRYQNCEIFGQALDTIRDYFSSDVPLTGGTKQAVPTFQPKRETEIQNEHLKNAQMGVTEAVSLPKPAEEPQIPAKAEEPPVSAKASAPESDADIANLETKLLSRPDDWPPAPKNDAADIGNLETKLLTRPDDLPKPGAAAKPAKKSSAGTVVLVIVLIIVGFALLLLII